MIWIVRFEIAQILYNSLGEEQQFTCFNIENIWYHSCSMKKDCQNNFAMLQETHSLGPSSLKKLETSASLNAVIAPNVCLVSILTVWNLQPSNVIAVGRKVYQLSNYPHGWELKGNQTFAVSFVNTMYPNIIEFKKNDLKSVTITKKYTKTPTIFIWDCLTESLTSTDFFVLMHFNCWYWYVCRPNKSFSISSPV